MSFRNWRKAAYISQFDLEARSGGPSPASHLHLGGVDGTKVRQNPRRHHEPIDVETNTRYLDVRSTSLILSGPL